MSALERNPEVLASAPHEDLGSGTVWRGILCGPSQLTRRLDFLLYIEIEYKVMWSQQT